MNKLVIALIAGLILSSAAFANGNHNQHQHRHNHRHHHDGWAPAVGGMLIGIAIARANEEANRSSTPVIVESVPVYRPPVLRTYSCKLLVQDSDGTQRVEYATCVR